MTCLSLLTIYLLIVVSQADPMNIQEDLTGTMTKQARSLHVEVLPSAPVFSEAWEEVENSVFLLVREAPDKRSSLNLERMREHLMKRDPGYVAWTSVTNNMDVLGDT